MKIAGILLMIAGVMLWLGFLFQLPYLYELLKNNAVLSANIIGKLLYRIFILAAGCLMFYFGRKVYKSIL